MIEPYLTFHSSAAKAVAFYETVFNCSGKQMSHFADMPPHPDFPVADDMKGLVLHGSVVIEGTRVMFSDSLADMARGVTPVSLAITFDSPERARSAYDAMLAAGGEARMELGPQFFAKLYAWVVDPFGVEWQFSYGQDMGAGQ